MKAGISADSAGKQGMAEGAARARRSGTALPLYEGKCGAGWSGEPLRGGGQQEIAPATNDFMIPLNYAPREELSKVEGLRRVPLANVSHACVLTFNHDKGLQRGDAGRPSQRDYAGKMILQIIIDETGAAPTNLVNDLLDLSCLEAGRCTPGLCPFQAGSNPEAFSPRYDKLAGLPLTLPAGEAVWVAPNELFCFPIGFPAYN